MPCLEVSPAPLWALPPSPAFAPGGGFFTLPFLAPKDITPPLLPGPSLPSRLSARPVGRSQKTQMEVRFRKGEISISIANFRAGLLSALLGKLRPGLGKGLVPITSWCRWDFIGAPASGFSLGSCEDRPEGWPWLSSLHRTCDFSSLLGNGGGCPGKQLRRLDKY